MKTRRQSGKNANGFTLIEVLVTSSIALLVMGGTLSVAMWTMRRAAWARQMGYAQTETMKSSSHLRYCIRNAVAVNAIDESGDWVELRMPNGSVSRITYWNPTETRGMGQLVYMDNIASSTAVQRVVSEGLTKVMSVPSRNVFHQTSANTLRMAYRITEPLSPQACPQEIEFSVELRNN